jgi:hypothetical protein
MDRQKQIDLGAVYTPQIFAEQLVPDPVGPDDTLIDPSVGKGNLLVAALSKGWKEENLYGSDIDVEALRFCIQKFPKAHFQRIDVLKDNVACDEIWKREGEAALKPFDYKPCKNCANKCNFALSRTKKISGGLFSR